MTPPRALYRIQPDLPNCHTYLFTAPKQLDSQYQRAADHVEYKLDHGEMMALPDIVDDLLRRCAYAQENTSLFLSALAAGGEVWVWQTKSFERCRVEHNEGWCVALDGQIAATICYTN